MDRTNTNSRRKGMLQAVSLFGIHGGAGDDMPYFTYMTRLYYGRKDVKIFAGVGKSLTQFNWKRFFTV